MSKDKVEVLDAEVVDELSDPGYDFSGPPSKQHYGTRKKDHPSFTPTRRQDILQSTLIGAPLHIAAKSAGVREKTVDAWLKRGEEALEDYEAGRDLYPVDEDFLEFYVNYYRYKAKGTTRLLGILHKESAKNPHIALKLLEKREPEDFGVKQSIEMTGKVAHGHIHVDGNKLIGDDVAKKLSTDELRYLREMRVKQLTAGEKDDSTEVEVEVVDETN